MPYIKQDLRPKIDKHLEALDKELQCGGDYNYTMFKLIFLYLNGGKVRYKYLNEMIGMLECCKLELYRRIVGPYEDMAISKNGDVTGLDWLDEYYRDMLR